MSDMTSLIASSRACFGFFSTSQSKSGYRSVLLWKAATAARFAQPLGDVMVSTGREAQFTCVVVGQDAYKVRESFQRFPLLLVVPVMIVWRGFRAGGVPACGHTNHSDH